MSLNDVSLSGKVPIQDAKVSYLIHKLVSFLFCIVHVVVRWVLLKECIEEVV